VKINSIASFKPLSFINASNYYAFISRFAFSSFNLFSSAACSSSLSFCSFSSMRLTALGDGSCSSSVSSIGYANTMLSFDIASGSFSVTNVSFCFGFEGAGVFLAGTGFFGGINRI
jgi:hypothetical protein